MDKLSNIGEINNTMYPAIRPKFDDLNSLLSKFWYLKPPNISPLIKKINPANSSDSIVEISTPNIKLT